MIPAEILVATLRELVELKAIKRKIDARTATNDERERYKMSKAKAWNDAEALLQDAPQSGMALMQRHGATIGAVRTSIVETALRTFPSGHDEYGVYTLWKEELDKALEHLAPFSERTPAEQMASGGHSIGVFKDGKLIAADAEVYFEPRSIAPLAATEQMIEAAIKAGPVKDNEISRITIRRMWQAMLEASSLSHERAPATMDSTSIPSQRLASSEALPSNAPDEPCHGETQPRSVGPRLGTGGGVSQADREERLPLPSAPSSKAAPVAYGSQDGYWVRAEDWIVRPDKERFTEAFYAVPSAIGTPSREDAYRRAFVLLLAEVMASGWFHADPSIKAKVVAYLHTVSLDKENFTVEKVLHDAMGLPTDSERAFVATDGAPASATLSPTLPHRRFLNHAIWKLGLEQHISERVTPYGSRAEMVMHIVEFARDEEARAAPDGTANTKEKQ